MKKRHQPMGKTTDEEMKDVMIEEKAGGKEKDWSID